jgi:hypothetical protein
MSVCKNATVALVENLIVSLKATVVEALFQDYPGSACQAIGLRCLGLWRVRNFVAFSNFCFRRSAKKKKKSTPVNR